MAKLPRKISVLVIKNFGEVDIRLNVITGKFQAEVFDQTYYNTVKADLEAQIQKIVAASAKFEWTGVIEVAGLNQEYSNTDHRIEVGFSLDRYWVAKSEGGKWVKSDWEYADYEDTYPGRKKVRGDYRSQYARETRELFDNLRKPVMRKPERYSHYATFHLPYTEERWVALQGLQEKIKQLDQALANLMGTAAGWEMLQTGRVPMLLDRPKEQE